MNNKLFKASLAGVAAIAVAAGGTTFAAWSDFATEDAAAGAGFLRLNVSDREGSTKDIQAFKLAPGQNKYQEFFLASADSDNTPNGALTAKITDLTDTEDTPGTCTTNSEGVAEGNVADCGTVGELSSQASAQILYSDPVADASSCPNTGIYSNSVGTATLADQATKTFDLGTVAKGEGVCVRIEMSLPQTADNKVQGDDVAWTWQFDLAQA